MTKRSTLGGGTLLALALLFIGLTVLFNYALRGWRLDLTQNHLYTTAPGTDRILKNIKEPINLYFFFSEKTADQIPQLKTYGVRVREFLEELQARSGGNVRLHVIDPQPFSEDEDRASELGVKSAPVGASGSQFYFGMAGTNSTDGHAAIEFFDPAKEQFLEYDVVKLVYQLANPKKPVVAWLSTLPMAESFDQRTGQTKQPWAIYAQAQQLFDIRTVEATATKIDSDVSVLVLVHPKGLSPATQFAIDQYALRGGHIVAFVDPVAEADQSAADPQNPMAAMSADKSSHLGTLLTAWGVNFNPQLVLADRAHALSVSMHQGEPPVQHLGILGLDQSTFNSNDVVTAGLSNVNVATAGFLEPVKDSKTRFESILQSSAESEPLPVERFAMLFDPSTLRDGFKPTGKRYTIAARVTGTVKTMFPAGPPAGVTLAPGQTALKDSAKPLNLVVFADTDLLSNFLWVHEQNFFGQQVAQAWASNGDLVLNTLDNLSGSTDLISVRGRATFTRPFERVEALRRSADDRFRAKEQELEQQLRDAEGKLNALQNKRNDKSAVILTAEQEKELDHFQEEKLRIRKQLRAVRAGLDEDIKGLGTELKIVNIVVVPIAFAIAVLLFALWRRRRRVSLAVNKENKP
ncbi:MAG: transporter gliding motility auxiliary component [Gammaproteobacteria bacterium]|nr:transporter gliding motility auxiliary component [Gammaproteobacteria bacterium]